MSRFGSSYRNVAAVALLLLLGSVGTAGCSKGYNLTVALDPQFAGSDVQPVVPVEIVGVSQGNYERWANMDMNAYFGRQKSTIALPTSQVPPLKATLSRQNPRFTVSGNDPVWKQWEQRGVEHIFVLAHWPKGDVPQQRATADPRRAVLPASPDELEKREVTLTIDQAGLSDTNRRRPR